jgi:uncharacterized membrane protein
MTWLQRYRASSFVRSSVWLPPVVGMFAALLLHQMIQRVDLALGWQSSVGPDGARAVLGALASSMLTFIVFVFSILLVAVQLASAQLTPRIIAVVYRSRVIKISLTVFVYTFTYTLAVLSEIEQSVPQVSQWLAVYSNVFCIALFIYMIDHVGKSLRPISLLVRIGNIGQEVLKEVYPRSVFGTDDAPTNEVPRPHVEPSRDVTSRHTGTVLAFDVAGTLRIARRTGCVIELVPRVGDFVTRGDLLFRVCCSGDAITDQLHHVVAIGHERTIEQDPAFAFRMIVDIACKALSPAINDPTTAVLALDQIHRLMRTVVTRQLDTGRVLDDAGRLRLVYRTPDWEDFVNLSFTEIRLYGRESIQVVRRMRAVLENLISIAPPQRVALLREELELLSRGIARDFRDPDDQVRAASPDSLGV